MLAVFPAVIQGQAASSIPSGQQTPPQVPTATGNKTAKLPSGSDRQRAVKLFLDASKLFEKEKFEDAVQRYQEAATLDPSNANYPLAAALARSHAVTALIQVAAKDRLRGDKAAERAALTHALELDPRNIQVTEHLHELGDDVLGQQSTPLYEQAASTVAPAVPLAHTTATQDFHLRTDGRQAIQQVFKAYGLDATVDDSVRPTQVRLDVDGASFEQAIGVLSLLTSSFYVPLDAHRVLVARDTVENRQQFLRQEVETIYLSGLTSTELTDVGNLAKNVFDVHQQGVDPSAGTITIRAPERALNALNATIRDLLDGRNQVMLEVQLIQLAHANNRNTGIQPPQAISAFNAYAEEQSILNANQSLVQQIISSGLAAPGDTLAILGILLASGQVSSSLFSNGIALFGGGLTQSALSPGSVTANLNLNSSDSRALDDMQLRLSDGEPGTVRSGTRYPIQTSSFSSLSGNLPNIPGLTGAGSSTSLSALLSSLTSGVPNVPQVEYQDLGLTLRATPQVMRNKEVALTIDMKIDALAGTAINGNPILNNRAYSGVVSLRQGEGVVVISDLNKQESRAISGVPGISEIPGLNNATDKNTQKSYATLLIVITPHVIRGTQAAGHSPMMRVERSTTAR
jgi:tetratricopeptide (TPR) repeat protein